MSDYTTVESFLDFMVQATANTKYSALILGIADHYSDYGTLTKKQRKAIRTNASVLKIEIPDAFEQMADDSKSAEQYEQAYQPDKPVTEKTLHALLVAMADVFRTYAEKLKP
jgi:hypothetical protein